MNLFFFLAQFSLAVFCYLRFLISRVCFLCPKEKESPLEIIRELTETKDSIRQVSFFCFFLCFWFFCDEVVELSNLVFLMVFLMLEI